MIMQTLLSLSKVLHTKKEKKTVLDNYITVNSRMHCCQKFKTNYYSNPLIQMGNNATAIKHHPQQ